jgi:peroxiredoxin
MLGAMAPNISFTRPDGASGTLAQYAGKPLLLVFLRHLA